jgi:2,4'-dihydroxyacetophenone dioxygenase
MSVGHLGIDTAHVHGDELPWVSGGNVTFRLLLARPEENLIVTHWRSKPNVASGVHRHLGSVLVYTLAGTWSHRPDVMDYRPGSYVSEPVGAVHQFFAGPTEVEAVGYSFGDNETIGPDGEVTGRETFKDKLDLYYRLCETQGFGRPKILT